MIYINFLVPQWLLLVDMTIRLWFIHCLMIIVGLHHDLVLLIFLHHLVDICR